MFVLHATQRHWVYVDFMKILTLDSKQHNNIGYGFLGHSFYRVFDKIRFININSEDFVKIFDLTHT